MQSLGLDNRINGKESMKRCVNLLGAVGQKIRTVHERPLRRSITLDLAFSAGAHSVFLLSLAFPSFFVSFSLLSLLSWYKLLLAVSKDVEERCSK